jgi:membrane protease subunit (stomatin/prohibitin family)
MGLFDKLRHELIDIIDWTDDSGDTLVYRFPRYDNEIKYGAKLVVRESQAGAFINEGKLADVYAPGTYSLQTENMPILTTLKGWKYGFQSPFKAEVYFVSTRTFTDRKWGTKNPLMLRDPEFGIVRLRAFGTYAIKVIDPAAFLRQVAGTEARFTVEQIEDQLRDLVLARFADALGSSKMSALDLAGNYDRLGRLVAAQIQPDFTNFGLQIVNLLVENISMPPEVEAAMDKRTSMGVIGNMQTYTQYEAASALPTAAANPGGIAGAGAGVAMGYAMANQMAAGLGAMQSPPSGSAPSGPPPIPAAMSYYLAIDGKQAGPFAADQLSQKVAAGQLTRETLVWKHGLSAWQKAGAVAELEALFADVPPPLAAQ